MCSAALQVQQQREPQVWRPLQPVPFRAMMTPKRIAMQVAKWPLWLLLQVSLAQALRLLRAQPVQLEPL